jgi:tetratricopeptide (TPR) repeat protein
MIKLKQVILQLSTDSYQEIEESFKKTKADNFELLFKAYRHDAMADGEIIDKLGISANSFYVLKSRLYDKIQEHLSIDVFSDRETLVKELLQVHEICFTKPRETAIAFLLKLEKELLKYDLHNDLLIVYSALKKMNLYSEKYFHYSQLFNKHAGLGLSLEKAEEILGNFNRMLGQYNFSRSQPVLDSLLFLKLEIANLYALNPSRQIGIIRNLVDLQLMLFCYEATEYSIEELLQGTRKVFAELPETAAQKKWEIVLDYLCFEYYFSKNEPKAALQYYEKINQVFTTLLLYNNICLTSKFLVSKIKFCDELDRAEDLDLLVAAKDLLYDSGDIHAKVLMEIHTAMLYFKYKKTKEAINALNEVLNTVSFKDYFHESIDVKLTLAYFYLSQKDYDLVELTTKGVARKIKTEHPDKYNHVLHLIKVFDAEIASRGSAKGLAKSKDLFTLFLANNVKNNEVIAHLVPELKRKYQN